MEEICCPIILDGPMISRLRLTGSRRSEIKYSSYKISLGETGPIRKEPNSMTARRSNDVISELQPQYCEQRQLSHLVERKRGQDPKICGRTSDPKEGF
ncbi:hypothetical protein RRG08_037789 [Elysia crispata]|uniref:Uncharacterized protein n=1 Tax=Elysia crispata TaxID=231223 RepID=A0AAE1EDG7_9GAST|nr:hypothetical protein RRG08_037789 [Elysia crispata]